MIFKAIFVVLFVLYSVRASAININIYADGDTSENELSEISCNNKTCNQLCLLFGLPGGMCVGDKCKCDNSKGLMPDDDSSSNGMTPRSCEDKSCDQLCRRLGFKNGLCAGGKCKCDVLKKSSHQSRASYSAGDACNNKYCDLLCHVLGYPGGECVGDRCACRNSKSDQELYDLARSKSDGEGGHNHQIKTSFQDDPPVTALPGSCSTFICNNGCQLQNYIGGICFAGNCYCY